MCKQHLADATSCIGVCSSCLRERLFVVIAAEVQAQTDAYYKHLEAVQTQEDHRNPDNNPPPYISRTKSDTTSGQFHHDSIHKISDQRFYSTPQIGPNELAIAAPKKKKNSYGLSLLSGLFRSRSKKPDSNSTVSDSGDYCMASTSSPSWFSTIYPGHRKKQSQMISMDEKSCHNQHRGMSPSRFSQEGEHCLDGSDNGVSLDTLKKTSPAQRGHRTGRKSSHKRSSSSGITFCLSPLVRASPSRQWNQKGMTLDMMILSDKKVSMKSAASLWKNRSRKLADFGKFNLNR